MCYHAPLLLPDTRAPPPIFAGPVKVRGTFFSPSVVSPVRRFTQVISVRVLYPSAIALTHTPIAVRTLFRSQLEVRRSVGTADRHKHRAVQALGAAANERTARVHQDSRQLLPLSLFCGASRGNCCVSTPASRVLGLEAAAQDAGMPWRACKGRWPLSYGALPTSWLRHCSGQLGRSHASSRLTAERGGMR